jgi:hypothetical protein
MEDHLSSLKEVNKAGYHYSKYAMPYENNLIIFVGRELIRSLEEIRESDKLFI